jgi:hypothetical protein
MQHDAAIIGVASPLYQSSDLQPCGPGMAARTAAFLESATHRAIQ